MFTEDQKTALEQPLDPSRAKTNPNVYGTYLEGFDVINRANEIFGFDGWSDTLSIQHVGNGFLATVTVSAGGVTHSDTTFEEIAGRQGGAELAAKNAATTALKRALRKFGNQFGNELYDKDSELHALATPAGNAQPLTNQNMRSNNGGGQRRTPTLPASGQPNFASWPRDVAQEDIPDDPVCEVSGEPFTGYTSSNGKVYTPRHEAAWAMHEYGRMVKKKYANQ